MNNMIIRHIGHAEFFIETESGFRMVTDPYDATCGYPVIQTECDAALVSHAHHDHNAVETLKGSPVIIDRAGIYTPVHGVRITAVRGFHDEVFGTKRGETLLFLVETEGLRIVHLGDLGCLLNDEQVRILRNPDILMIPTGGFYTIDGKQAKKTAEMLNARVVLPMHYKTEYNAEWPISGPEVFLEEMKGRKILLDADALRITAGDMECQPEAVMFRQ